MKFINLFRNPHLNFATLFVFLAGATLQHIFATYEFGYEINVTSRPHQRSVILREIDDWEGTTVDIFVKSKNKITFLIKTGDDLEATKVEEMWWSKDGTLLIINETGQYDKPVAWDFLHERLIEDRNLTRTIKARGGRGQVLMSGYHVIGENRTAFTWEVAELEGAESGKQNAFKWRF